MHILAAAPAAHTEAPPDPGWFGALWNWTGSHLPGGNLTIIGALFLVGMLADGANKRGGTGDKTDWKKADQAVVGVFKKLFGTIAALFKAVWAILRFYGGRELRGEPRSDATWFRAGTPTTPVKAPVVSMESVALAPPKVSLVKPKRRQPSPWARQAADWFESYRGRGAAALDRAVRTALWLARMVGKVCRAVLAVCRALKAAYGFTAPILGTLARALRGWHCWPYAARGLARLVLTAALVGLAVPAWRTWTIVGLVVVAAGAFALAHRFRPTPPGDDAVYGPRIWAILRDDLDLPDDEPRENWMRLPASLAAPDARIVIRLPWTWRGSEGDRENLSALVNSRLPGEWVARVSLTGETFTAVYTHKPPPKPPAPEPTPPDSVDFFDAEIQEAIANCKRGQIVIGRDAFGQIITKSMGEGETPHWALSVGTGGGKSAFCQMVIAQLIAQGYYILAADVKRVSVANYIGVVGCYIYNDPMNPQDMRAGIDWFKEEIAARSAVSEVDPTAEFPGILCLIEEANEFADVSREWWDDNRKTRADDFGPADRAADPVWGTVASGARLGRHVYGNILAVFQDLRDQALGGKGLRNLFRLKFMGNFNKNSWDNVVGTKPVPESLDKAGRMMIVEGNAQYWVQTLYGTPDALRAWAIEARERTAFVEGAGLYGTPPKPSPKTLPRLLQGVSRDKLPEGLRGASEGGLSDETAGRGVTPEGDVTPGVTPQRDRLRLIPGQAGAEGSQDPLAAPVLLSVAELAREMQARGYVIEAELIRQHKSRRDKGNGNGFPVGIGEGRDEKFTVDQLIAFYEKRGIEKREESEAETEQGDAI
ncbi:hypothetical protein [Streptomyces albidoflavus]|uniref:hypothetical protein n=1 Tax=Streptomyces albidoflavus TaxID=1886 RepID=UPI003324AAEB